MIPLAKFEEHLDAITSKQWDKLFRLLPKIEKATYFSSYEGKEDDKEDTMYIHHWTSSNLIDKTSSIILDLSLDPVFDYSSWAYGLNILDTPDFNYTTLDKITLCKLITCIYRIDRFNEGYLISCFKNGTFFKIINSLKRAVYFKR